MVALPIAALFLRVSPATVLEQLQDPGVQATLLLSLETSVAAAVISLVLGLPMAHLLASRSFPGKRAIEVLLDLPMVIPPTVAGFALLMAFGRAGLLGGSLSGLGNHTSVHHGRGRAGAGLHGDAIPGRCGAGRPGGGGAAVPRGCGALRAGPIHTFWRVRLPLAMPSVIAGLGMCWARALGEFGATITFAGNLAGTTRTVPLDVYLRLHEDLDAATTLSVLLIVMAAVLLTAMRQAGLGLFAPPRAPRHAA